MPDRDKDEVARALEQLASGGAGEGDAVQPAPAPPPVPPARRPPSPGPARPAMPPGQASGRPAHPPGTAPPPAPRPPGAAPGSVATPPQRMTPQRPAAPARLAAPQPLRAQMPVVESSAVDEDDAVIVPAPPPSAFLPYRGPTTQTKSSRLSLRRTLIPILLTCGVILLVLGTMPLFLSEENPLSQLPRWISFSLWGLGLLLLALAVVNMLAVKHLLETQEAAATGPR